MATYDHYEPSDIRCPACDQPFSDWRGEDGPGRFFLYRQGARQPVDQLVDEDARTPEREWPQFGLPSRFLIAATGEGHMASATGACDEGGTWIETFLHYQSWGGCPVNSA